MSQAGTWNAPFLTANATPLGAEAAFVAGVAANQSYLNIHSTTFPGGEIRGFLVLNRFAAAPGLSAGAAGAATALDSLGAGTGSLNNALVALAVLTPAQQAAAIEQLTPSASRASFMVTSEAMSLAFDQVSNRLDGLRVAPGGAPLGGNSVWLMGDVITGRQKLEDGFAGYEDSGWGVSAGVDGRLAPATTVGVAVGYSDSELKYRDQAAGNKTDVTSTQVSLYASQDVALFYLDAAIAYAWHSFEGDRNTGATGAASGDYDGHQWGFRVGGGMPIPLSPMAWITPQAHLDWDSATQDAYTESSGDTIALAVSSRSADRIRSSLGARFDLDAGLGGLGARPFVRGFWHHDFDNDGIDTSASFVAGGAAFVTPGQEFDSDQFTVGAGVDFFSSGAFAAALVWDGTWGSSYDTHVFQAKARWIF
jgi:outer membrane autotransporter protein